MGDKYKVMVECTDICPNFEPMARHVSFVADDPTDAVQAIYRSSMLRDQTHHAWVEKIDEPAKEKADAQF